MGRKTVYIFNSVNLSIFPAQQQNTSPRTIRNKNHHLMANSVKLLNLPLNRILTASYVVPRTPQNTAVAVMVSAAAAAII